MSKQAKNTEAGKNTRRQPVQMEGPSEMSESPGLAAMTFQLLSGAAGDPVENQAGFLLQNDHPLVQRQAVAHSIAAGLGNRHLERVLQTPGRGIDVLDPQNNKKRARQIVQRQDPEQGQESEGPSPELLQKIAYAQSVLSKTPPLPKDKAARVGKIIGSTPIYSLILEKRKKAATIKYYSEVLNNNGSVPGFSSSELNDEIERLTNDVENLDSQIQAALPALKVSSEDQIVEQVETEFPGLWVERARQIALAMLDEHERVVEAERNRYSTQFSPAQGSRTAGAEELKTADAALKIKYDELKTAKDFLDQSEKNLYGDPDNPPPPGSSARVPSQAKIEAIKTAREQLQTKNNEMKASLQQWGSQYPVLMSPGYTPGAFAALSPEKIEHMTGEWLQKIEENIAETRNNINDESIKVWDLKHIPTMTYQSLDVLPDSPLGMAVQNHIKGKKSNAELLSKAYSVLQVGLAVATVAAGMIGGPMAAPLLFVLSTGFGVMELIIDIDKYLQEAAAGNVSLNPAFRDISNLEPQLLPIALDLLTLGMDIASIPDIVRSLKSSLSALRSGRKAAGEFVEEAVTVGMPRETAESLAKRYAARAADLDEITQVLKVLGNNARAAITLDDVLLEIKKFALPEVSDFLQMMRADGHIVLLPVDKEAATDALIRALGEEEAHEVVTSGLLKAGGFYDPVSGIIFAKTNSFGYTQSIIVHEAVHAIQKEFGKAFHGFTAEFQAFVVQRNYLKRLANTMPVESLPELGWLVHATDDEIVRFLESNPLYKHAVPDWFEVQEAVLELLDDFDRLGKTGIKVNI